MATPKRSQSSCTSLTQIDGHETANGRQTDHKTVCCRSDGSKMGRCHSNRNFRTESGCVCSIAEQKPTDPKLPHRHVQWLLNGANSGVRHMAVNPHAQHIKARGTVREHVELARSRAMVASRWQESPHAMRNRCVETESASDSRWHKTLVFACAELATQSSHMVRT